MTSSAIFALYLTYVTRSYASDFLLFRRSSKYDWVVDYVAYGISSGEYMREKGDI